MMSFPVWISPVSWVPIQGDPVSHWQRSRPHLSHAFSFSFEFSLFLHLISYSWLDPPLNTALAWENFSGFPCAWCSHNPLISSHKHGGPGLCAHVAVFPYLYQAPLLSLLLNSVTSLMLGKEHSGFLTKVSADVWADVSACVGFCSVLPYWVEDELLEDLPTELLDFVELPDVFWVDRMVWSDALLISAPLKEPSEWETFCCFSLVFSRVTW